MSLRLKVGVYQTDYEVGSGGHGLHHPLLVQLHEGVQSGARLGVSKAQLATRIQTVGEELAIFVFYDTKVISHRNIFDKRGPWRGYFEWRKIDTLNSLPPPE